MRCRVKFLAKAYLWTVLVFVLAKVAFMLFCHQGHEFSIGDIWQVVSHGITLDLSTALYFLILPFLLSMLNVWYWVKWLNTLLRGYFLLISVAFALAFVADTSLYPFWGFKLDASCIQYLESPNEMAASVSVLYIILRLLALAITTIVIFGGYRPLALQSSTNTLRQRLLKTFLYILCMPLIVIGIRGGVSDSTTNIGQVYYSQNQFLNHAAVNPVFSFLDSMDKTDTEITVYAFMDDAECERIINDYYNTQSIDTDSLLNTSTPNIIIILMEGCGGEFTEIGGREDITPNLNRLAQEGVYFTNCYANSWRTDRGTLCTLSGYPAFPSWSVMKMPSKTRTLPNIAKSLQKQGYHTHYLYGGDINFTNMRSYLITGGFENLTWKADYSSSDQNTAQWGVRDDITFNTLYDLCTSLQSPYLIGYSTLSSHEPWDVPIHQLDDEKENAFYYLDQCIGSYVQKLRQSPVWDNTLVILLPDHGINHKDIDELHPLRNHIPMIWIGGAVKEPRRIEQVCNQTDLPATLLAQLGIDHGQYTFSRDVLSKTYTRPFAIQTNTEGFSMYDSVSFVNYDMHSNRVAAEQGRKNPELIHRAKAILQATSKDLDQR